MWDKLKRIFTIPDLRRRIVYVILLLLLTRFLAHIPIPGVDLDRLKALFSQNQLFGLLDIFSGGGLGNFSIAMLGVGPYITASIIIQLLTIIVPSLADLSKEGGEAGRTKINQYTRYLTVPLAALQTFGTITFLIRAGGTAAPIVPNLTLAAWIVIIASVSAGSVLMMWLGEVLTEYGVGNGISLIIFAGIVARILVTIQRVASVWDPSLLITVILFVVLGLLVILGIVYVNEGQRNIPVSYAKRVRGDKLYGGVSTHLPLRVNQAGVIPIIFAISIMLFPGVIASYLSQSPVAWVSNAALTVTNLFNNQLFYGITYFILVILFTYFYTAVIFNPDEVAENIQKQGGFIPGIRPGAQTAEYLNKVMNRITLAGAIFLGLIAILPYIIQHFTALPSLAIGGTSLLIVVSVVIETMKQLESQIVMRDYEGF